MSFEFRATKTRLLIAVLLLVTLAGCASGQKNPTIGQVDADKFLFDRGTQLLAKKNWRTAREYFRRLVDSYPQSQYRHDAKLGIGDSFLGENRVDSLILAVNEFREFLTFFTSLHPRADYAQYRLALAQSKQMLRAERDQTATVETLAEVQKFRDTYPTSKYRPEVDKIYRTARDRLSESEFKIGLTYYRGRVIVGAVARFEGVLRDDPGYTRKDQVYFYLAQAYMKVNGAAGAIAYYQKLLEEFPKSKHAREAKKKLALLMAPPKTPTSPPKKD